MVRNSMDYVSMNMANNDWLLPEPAAYALVRSCIEIHIYSSVTEQQNAPASISTILFQLYRQWVFDNA